MAEKHTTLAQAKQIALRTKAEMLAMLSDALGGVQVGMTITLPAASWEGRAQTIQDERFLANSKYWYLTCPDADNFVAGSDAGIRADNVTTNGQMTFRCEIIPETDIIVNIIRLEVDTNEQQP